LNWDLNYDESGRRSCSKSDSGDGGRAERRAGRTTDERPRANGCNRLELVRAEDVFRDPESRVEGIENNRLNNVANEAKETHLLPTLRGDHLGFPPVSKILGRDVGLCCVIFRPCD